MKYSYTDQHNKSQKTMLSLKKKKAKDAKVPAGSFYLYVKAPKATADGTQFENGEAFSQWLIRNKLISSVPWDDAGHFVRFSATFVARGGIEDEKRVLDEFARRLGDCKFVF